MPPASGAKVTKLSSSERVISGRQRHRRMCTLVAGAAAPAAIRHISARGAFLETNARPALGMAVELQHPQAGAVQGMVSGIGSDGISIAFVIDARAVAFALATITAGMSRAA